MPQVSEPSTLLSSLGTVLAGVAPERILVVICLLLAYPLAHLFRCLPSNHPTLRHAFSVAATLVLFVGIQGQWIGLAHLLTSALATFTLVDVLRKPWMPWVVSAVAMLHLAWTHWQRLSYNLDNPPLDYSGAHMVLVIKLTSFAFNVADGRVSSDQVLSSRQQAKAIRGMPTFMEFMGYIFFFGNFLVGPAIEYRDYIAFVDPRENSSLQENPTAQTVSSSASRPSDPLSTPLGRSTSLRSAYIELTGALAWIMGAVVLDARFPPQLMAASVYHEWNFSHRLLFLLVTCFTVRMPYYAAWKLAKGACILTGMGFNGYDETTDQPHWDKFTNVYPGRFEGAQNLRAMLEAWNVATSVWLRNYVYLRVAPRGKKPGIRATFLTFFMSALWHGFFPGYYLAFLTISFMSSVARTLRRTIRPIFVAAITSDDPHEQPPLTRYKTFYDTASWLLTQVALSYAIVPFILLDFDKSIEAWRANYFLGHLLLLAIVLILRLGGSRILRRFHYRPVKSHQQ
ncbi:Lysophospholipid acyltransferase [Dispira parvispora]|uniref:Lysophospholipid acyltransferase n=1 Tax=Dispira parvispora TaxID=1520584 RepID=A0A9W8ALH6_9FUNG|nr:Lysophospholipid acyltransferase [Dispira parvispora]